MATSDISSSFVIRVSQLVAAAETINVANPGRTFTVQRVDVKFIALQSDISTSTVQVSRIRSGAASVLFGSPLTASRAQTPAWVSDANPQCGLSALPAASSNFLATDNLRVAVGGAATQCSITLYCTGNPSQSLTVT